MSKRRLHQKTETEGEGNEVEFDRDSMSLEHLLAEGTISIRL